MHRVTQKHLLAPSLPALPSTMADAEVKLRCGDDAMCEVEKDVVECVPPPTPVGWSASRAEREHLTVHHIKHTPWTLPHPVTHSTRPIALPRRRTSTNRNWWVRLSL